MYFMRRIYSPIILFSILVLMAGCAGNQKNVKHADLPFIRVSEDRTGFVYDDTGETFLVWGFNYDHDESGRLIEDYWHAEWETVVGDFAEMKELGANVVRVHLQVGKFMNSPTEPNEASLEQLAKMLKLAEEVGLYLDVTGLGCYHKQDVPGWYDELGEAERWEVQSRFWGAVAETCAGSPAVFCYDLMNEPVLDGGENKSQWLAGEFAGSYFVQRITLDLAGRNGEDVAKAWVDKLVAAIREKDERHMITVGVIPWALVWPDAKALFYSEKAGENLDFASVHFYPKAGEIEKAIKALAVYDVGKPLVIEEMFPLECSVEEMDQFIDESAKFTDGWISFYWGKTIAEYSEPGGTLTDAIMAEWLTYFSAKKTDIINRNVEKIKKADPSRIGL